jgi:hypothetical protein
MPPKVKLPPPPGGAASPSGDGSGFIGVPDNNPGAPPSLGDWFRPEQQISTPGMLLGAAPRAPKYPDGTEDSLFDMGPEAIARLQADLASAGLIGPSTKFRVGVVMGTTDPTYAAFKKALGTANTMGTTWEEAVNYLAKTPQVQGDGTVVGAPNGPSTSVNTTTSDPVLTDPVTARATLRTTLEQRLGRAPTADEYHQFRSMLTNSEGGQDVTTVTNTPDGQGNITRHVKHSDPTSDPSAADLADQFSRRGKVGKEANTHQIATDYYGAVASLIGN